MVDLEGFEPSTSSMPWRRAPNCATGPLARFLDSIALRSLELSVRRPYEDASQHRDSCRIQLVMYTGSFWGSVRPTRLQVR